ncbi:hypothetical protein SAMN05216480_10259 [Pustulibacterium marinum]|uniref:Uncharacterized protein n=1 Tax=Pustulibacterium marinum TaxID=1224947 RepID=A0A1I7FNC9_9FLAO|nr:hypothetical protein SAMN05216480_10259 [Pustulibacterium marinum]
MQRAKMIKMVLTIFIIIDYSHVAILNPKSSILNEKG